MQFAHVGIIYASYEKLLESNDSIQTLRKEKKSFLKSTWQIGSVWTTGAQIDSETNPTIPVDMETWDNLNLFYLTFFLKKCLLYLVLLRTSRNTQEHDHFNIVYERGRGD